MALVMLALPGAVFVYNGEELGLPNVDLPDEVLQDPMWERSGHTRARPRRVPGADAVGGRRSAVRLLRQSATPGCRCPPEWAALTVEQQLADPDSTLSFFRAGASNCATAEANSAAPTVEWLDAPDDALAFRVSGGLVCALNAGTRADRAARR